MVSLSRVQSKDYPPETRGQTMILDLCSGLGGASQAFVDAGDEVVMVDVERALRPTILADAAHLPIKTNLKPELILFCPPCQCFSVANISRHWDRGKPKTEKCEKAIKLVKDGLKEIQRLSPHYWVMENPMGMLRTIVGKPPNTIRMTDYGGETKKPTDLWGNVPFRMLSALKPWPKSPRGARNTPHNRWYRRHQGESSWSRAKWPYGLSQAVREATIST